MTAPLNPTVARSVAGQGAVCFTLDDGYSSWPQIADEADARGIRLTFGLTVAQLTAGGGVTASQIEDLFNRGHEIANHSVTHASYTTATAADRANESDICSEVIGSITGKRPTTFFYPFGSRSATTDQELFGRFDRIRDFRQAATSDITQPNQFLVPSINTTSNALAYQRIALAARQPVVTTLATHNPGGNLRAGGAADPLSLADFVSQLQYAYELGVPCVRMDEAFSGGGMLADASFEHDPTVLSVWRGFNNNITKTVVTPDAGIFGADALQIAPTTIADTGVRQIVPVTPGRSYTLSGRAQKTAGTSGSVVARLMAVPNYWGDETGAPTGSVVATTSAITSTTWTRFEVSYEIPQGQRFIDVQLAVTGQTANDVTAQFDHIHFGPTEFGAFG